MGVKKKIIILPSSSRARDQAKNVHVIIASRKQLLTVNTVIRLRVTAGNPQLMINPIKMTIAIIRWWMSNRPPCKKPKIRKIAVSVDPTFLYNDFENDFLSEYYTKPKKEKQYNDFENDFLSEYYTKPKKRMNEDRRFVLLAVVVVKIGGIPLVFLFMEQSDHDI